jgi:hypothetical protein
MTGCDDKPGSADRSALLAEVLPANPAATIAVMNELNQKLVNLLTITEREIATALPGVWELGAAGQQKS